MLESPSAASREFGSPPPRSSRRRRQRRQLLQAAAAVALGLLVVGVYSWGQATKPTDTTPARQVATRVFKLEKALERHAARERQPGEAAYPSSAQFVAFVRALPEGAELLANPYGEPAQAGPVAPVADLPTAAQRHDHAAKPLPNTVLGPGAAPGSAYTALTYGALVYDHDPKSDSFVLYGIAQDGDKAVMAAEADSGL